MKYLKEVTIIFGITMLGEFLNYLLPFPVPSGVYGLFILLLMLCTGALHTEDVAEVGDFFLDTMPIMFIPAGVGLLDSVQEAESILVPLTVITVISTVFVMVATGCVAQGIIRRKNKRESMNGLIHSSLYFGMLVSYCAYMLGVWLKKEDRDFKSAAGCNYSCDCILSVFHIEEAEYNRGAVYLSYFSDTGNGLSGDSLYKQLELLRQHLIASLRNCGRGYGSVGSICGCAVSFNWSIRTM